MLDDRAYMRSASAAPYRSVTVTLLIINAVIFLVQSVVAFYYDPRVLNHYFALSLEGLRQGFVWQLLTFQFMHAGLWHLLLNLLTIYVFGRSVEETLGRSTFVKLYLIGGTVGGLLQVFAALVAPQHFGVGGVLGASAGAFSLMAAFATLFPERQLTLLVAFIIPVTLRAKYLLLFGALLTLFGILVPTDRVAHVAHLGGLLTGIGFIRWGDQALRLFARRRATHPPVRRTRQAVPLMRKKTSWKSGVTDVTDATETPAAPPVDFISQEVDPILDKISAQGLQSLTPHERKVLEAARARMARR